MVSKENVLCSPLYCFILWYINSREGGNTSNLELSSRMTEDIRVSGTYQAYWSTNDKDVLYNFRRDNYLGFKVIKYF